MFTEVSYSVEFILLIGSNGLVFIYKIAEFSFKSIIQNW